MELHFVAPILTEGDLHFEEGWQNKLAEDYLHPAYHVSMWVAMGRRIRRNYFWILLIQTVAYVGKLIVHPTAVTSFAEFVSRAAIGPIPGWIILTLGVVYCISWGVFALWSWSDDKRKATRKSDPLGMG